MEVSEDSFIDIIWPIIREYGTKKDCVWPFTKLQEYFSKNGCVLDYQSENLIALIFEETADVIRKEIFDYETPDLDRKQYEQCYGFLSECAAKMAEGFKIPPISEEKSNKALEDYMDKWFARYIRNAGNNESNQRHLLRFENAQDYLKFLQNPKGRMQDFSALSADEICEEALCANPELKDGDGPIFQYVIDATFPIRKIFENRIDDKLIENILVFLNNCPNVKNQYETATKVRFKLKEMYKEAKLSKYYENPKFIENCKKLISVLTSEDRYHGTNYEALESIMHKGLCMVQEDLDRTSIPMYKFDDFGNKDALLESLLLYRTGIDNARGEGMVFFSGDAKVKPLPQGEKASVGYSMTGPLGIHYKVNSSDIIGTIDAVNMQVEFGPNFEKRNTEPES